MRYISIARSHTAGLVTGLLDWKSPSISPRSINAAHGRYNLPHERSDATDVFMRDGNDTPAEPSISGPTSRRSLICSTPSTATHQQVANGRNRGDAATRRHRHQLRITFTRRMPERSRSPVQQRTEPAICTRPGWTSSRRRQRNSSRPTSIGRHRRRPRRLNMAGGKLPRVDVRDCALTRRKMRRRVPDPQGNTSKPTRSDRQPRAGKGRVGRRKGVKHRSFPVVSGHSRSLENRR